MVSPARTRRLPPRGSFDHQCAVGPFRPDPADADRHRTYHGLSLESTTCTGTFRDPAGVLVVVIRRMGTDWGLPLVVRSAEDGTSMRDHTDLAERAWAGAGLEDAPDDGIHRWRSRPRGPVQPFELGRGSDRITWEEGDIVSVEGSLVGGVGVQWYDPTPPGALQASEVYRVRGNVAGRAVEGFVAFEQRYLPHGHLWTDTPYLGRGRLQIARTVFGTEWDDGALEAGLICGGRRAWGAAFIVGNDGPSVATSSVGARVRRDGLGWSDRVAYRLSEDAWEWTVDPRGRIQDVPWLAGNALVSEGLVQRTGERRRPITWMGRSEVAPARTR